MRTATSQSAQCAATRLTGRVRCQRPTGHAGAHEGLTDTQRLVVWPNDAPPDAIEMPLFDRRKPRPNAIQEGR